MTETGCDPAAYINSLKRPLDPNRSQPFPDRVIALHNQGGTRTPEEKARHSTFYPMKPRSKKN